jgi:F-type H+-transporting ATPase subunit a
VASTPTTTKPRRIGFKRWIVLALIVLGAYLAFFAKGIFTPVSPAVVLPGEPVWHGVTWMTNTLLSTLVADVLLFLLAFSGYRYVKSGKLVPQGFYNFWEFLVEFLWNATESTAGKWARRIFPWMATIFMLVFFTNIIRVIPGFETIGWLEQSDGHHQGYAPVQLLPGFYATDGSHPVDVAHAEGEDEHAVEDEHAAAGMCTSCVLVPFLRGAATDLNFTFALAVIAVVMVEVFGVWALGRAYFGKFFNTGGMISKPFFGVIDFGVGLLELVSEFSKILSFGFRLFGNIFAGALLLSIVGALTAVVVPSMLYALEIFVGIIQAYVFAMLALVFMSQATVSHHAEGHAEEHGAEAAPAH